MKPVIIYIAVSWGPRRTKASMTAAGFIMGVATRKARVGPK
jgi:hypothetical protein